MNFQRQEAMVSIAQAAVTVLAVVACAPFGLLATSIGIAARPFVLLPLSVGLLKRHCAISAATVFLPAVAAAGGQSHHGSVRMALRTALEGTVATSWRCPC